MWIRFNPPSHNRSNDLAFTDGGKNAPWRERNASINSHPASLVSYYLASLTFPRGPWGHRPTRRLSSGRAPQHQSCTSANFLSIVFPATLRCTLSLSFMIITQNLLLPDMFLLCGTVIFSSFVPLYVAKCCRCWRRGVSPGFAFQFACCNYMINCGFNLFLSLRSRW